MIPDSYDTAMSLAEMLSEFGRKMYRDNGWVLPQVSFASDSYEMTFILQGSGPVHPTDAVAIMTGMFGKVKPFRFISFICEAWTKTMEAEEASSTFQRGDLARGADTDPEVRTTVLCFVYDVARPDTSHVVMSTTDESTLPDVSFNVQSFDGMADGLVPSAIHAAYSQAPSLPEEFKEMPNKFLMESSAAVFASLGLITASSYAELD